MDVEVGTWVAFAGRGAARLLGQVVGVSGSDPVEVRIWCSELMDVVPVAPSAVLEEIESASWSPRPVRRASADGS